MVKWLSVLPTLVEKIPLERIFVRPDNRREYLEKLRNILAEAKPEPVQPAAKESQEEEESPGDELKGFLQPRRQKVHLHNNPAVASTVSDKETVDYQNREIGKLLLRMERHYAQKLMINGKKCDCGASKHLLDIEALAEETISMVDNPDIYYRIMNWVREVGPLSTVDALMTGRYDDEYPQFSTQARDFRKDLLGTLEASALFPKKGIEPAGSEETE